MLMNPAKDYSDSKTPRAPYTYDNQSTKVVSKFKTIARIENIGTAVPGWIKALCGVQQEMLRE